MVLGNCIEYWCLCMLDGRFSDGCFFDLKELKQLGIEHYE